MQNKERLLENYAELILKRGVGLRAGQILVVEETSVTAIEFLRILTKKAYERKGRSHSLYRPAADQNSSGACENGDPVRGAGLVG